MPTNPEPTILRVWHNWLQVTHQGPAKVETAWFDRQCDEIVALRVDFDRRVQIAAHGCDDMDLPVLSLEVDGEITELTFLGCLGWSVFAASVAKTLVSVVLTSPKVEFMQEYCGNPVPLTNLPVWESKLRKLAREYHDRTEAYDRTVCTGPLVHGAIMPATEHEGNIINNHAQLVRDELGAKAAELGFTPQQWRTAIYNSRAKE
jgi:hypothetical protein